MPDRQEISVHGNWPSAAWRGDGRDLGRHLRRAQLQLKAGAGLARVSSFFDPTQIAFRYDSTAIGRAEFQ